MSLPDSFKRAMERKPVYADTDNRAQRESPDFKPTIRREPLAAEENSRRHSPRTLVRVRSYRCILADAEALVCKFHVDALGYFGILEGDTTGHIKVEMPEQFKVATKAEERTEIELSELP